MTVLRITLWLVAGIAAIAAALAATGYALPVAHIASRHASFNRSVDDVYAAVADVGHYVDWRSDVSRVTILSASPLRWREEGKNGAITYVVVESHQPSRLVTRIDDRSLPFGGTWSYSSPLPERVRS